MEWYKWVFDGVGGAGLAAICTALVRSWARHKKPRDIAGAIQSSQVANISAPVGSSQIAVGTNIRQKLENHHHHYQPDIGPPLLRNTEPTPTQIMEELRGVAPFDLENASRKYIGIPILWKLRFSAVSDLGHGEPVWLIHTDFVPDSKEECWRELVTFQMTEIPPLLKSAPQDSVLWVRGSVSSAIPFVKLNRDPEILNVERPNRISTPPNVAPFQSVSDRTSQIESNSTTDSET